MPYARRPRAVRGQAARVRGAAALTRGARRFRQVDVFTTTAYAGNPVAVVLDGDGLTAEQMARFTCWTNLSEATFVVPPTRPDADYRVRIFTTAAETETAPVGQPSCCRAPR